MHLAVKGNKSSKMVLMATSKGTCWSIATFEVPVVRPFYLGGRAMVFPKTVKEH